MILSSAILQLVLVVGAFLLLYKWVSSSQSQRKNESIETELVEVKDRLTETEQRLTDVQDVMIALSEKFDRWEEQAGVKGGSHV